MPDGADAVVMVEYTKKVPTPFFLGQARRIEFAIALPKSGFPQSRLFRIKVLGHFQFDILIVHILGDGHPFVISVPTSPSKAETISSKRQITPRFPVSSTNSMTAETFGPIDPAGNCPSSTCFLISETEIFPNKLSSS